jgi:catechol 2,3-dioxygenase-like lactoylglutathione lyase family enzyme
MPVLIERIDHVQLAMPLGAEDRAREFYHGVLGIPEVPKPDHMAKRGGCWFERSELKVHLGADAEFRAARKAHPAFIVAGLQSLADKLVSLGYSVRNDDPVAGHVRIQVDDPFGNRIEFMEAAGG